MACGAVITRGARVEDVARIFVDVGAPPGLSLASNSTVARPRPGSRIARFEGRQRCRGPRIGSAAPFSPDAGTRARAPRRPASRRICSVTRSKGARRRELRFRIAGSSISPGSVRRAARRAAACRARAERPLEHGAKAQVAQAIVLSPRAVRCPDPGRSSKIRSSCPCHAGVPRQIPVRSSSISAPAELRAELRQHRRFGLGPCGQP